MRRDAGGADRARALVRAAVLAAVLLLALLAAPGVALARGPVTKSLQAGGSVARLSSLDAPQGDSRTRTGAVVGIGLRYRVSARVDLQSGMLYAQRGGRYDVVFRDFLSGYVLGTGVSRYVLDYLEVPLLVRLRVLAPGRARISLLGGPGVAFKVRGRKVYTDLEFDRPDVPEERMALASWARNVTASLSLGAGLDWPVGDLGFSLDVLYGHGLVDLQDGDGATVKQRSFTVLCGTSF